MLTASEVANAKPKDKPYKMADECGLFLLVMTTGAKYWRMKYRRPATRAENRRLAFGAYPDVSLKQARMLLADSINPAEKRQADKIAQRQAAADSFEMIAREFIECRLGSKAESYRSKVQRRLELYVFPYLGRRPVSAITAPEILDVLHRIESRGTLETTHRALQNIGQVIRYAIATARASFDPTPSLWGALQPVGKRHMAAPTDPDASRLRLLLQEPNT